MRLWTYQLQLVNIKFISSQQQPVENRCQVSHRAAPATNGGKRQGDFVLSGIGPPTGCLHVCLAEGEQQPVPGGLLQQDPALLGEKPPSQFSRYRLVFREAPHDFLELCQVEHDFRHELRLEPLPAGD